jgi:hypothetical protein
MHVNRDNCQDVLGKVQVGVSPAFIAGDIRRWSFVCRGVLDI